MKVFANPGTLALGVLATVAAGARIIVINDDSWYTANIRYLVNVAFTPMGKIT